MRHLHIAKKVIKSQALLSVFTILNAKGTSFINPMFDHHGNGFKLEEMKEEISKRMELFNVEDLQTSDEVLNNLLAEYQKNDKPSRIDAYDKCHSKEHIKVEVKGNGPGIGGGGSFSKDYSKEENCKKSLYYHYDDRGGISININYPQIKGFTNHDLFKKISYIKAKNYTSGNYNFRKNLDIRICLEWLR